MAKIDIDTRRKNMMAVKSTGTSIEVALSKFLFARGYRFRKNNKSIIGKPDLSLKKYKIAIFVDGEFWHGKDWELRKQDHKTNREFWIKKIEGNIERDRHVNAILNSRGWVVLRFWGKEIKKDLLSCALKVETAITEAKMNFNEKRSLQKKSNKYLKTQTQIFDYHKEAVITHFIHNNEDTTSNPWKENAIEYTRDFLEGKFPDRHITYQAAEEALQYNIFETFDVPFPPPAIPKFRFIDLFAGIGGFRLAMQNLGGKCVFSSEWDNEARKTYRANFGETPFGDITKEDIKGYIPDGFDILCAGFPCQAFSIAGKRGGFEDTRGTLFFDVAEIIKRKQPQAVFLENVKGLRNHNGGKTLATILNVLRNDLGYFVPEPEIVNAKYFGVPQNRERLYIVGFRSDLGISSFSYPEPLGLDVSFADVKEEDVVPTKYYLSTQYLSTLQSHKERHENKGNGFGYAIIPDDGIANAIVVGGMGRERNLVFDERISDFVPTTKIKGEVNRQGIRKMTPREWARLQGFPDHYVIQVADASAYKQFGNSVAVPAIQATAANLLKQLKIESAFQQDRSCIISE